VCHTRCTVRCHAPSPPSNSRSAPPTEDARSTLSPRLTTAHACCVQRCSSSAALLLRCRGLAPPPQRRSSFHGSARPICLTQQRQFHLRCALGSESTYMRKLPMTSIRRSPSSSLAPLAVLLLHCRVPVRAHPCLASPPRFLRCLVSIAAEHFSFLLRSPPPTGLSSSLRRLRSITSWRVAEPPPASSIWPALTGAVEQRCGLTTCSPTSH
jgi:hypothetical protein